MLDQMVAEAQRYMVQHQMAGWLVHSYRDSNPLFAELLGPTPMLTRPCFLYIPSEGGARILGHHVDAGALEHSGVSPISYRDRPSMVALLPRRPARKRQRGNGILADGRHPTGIQSRRRDYRIGAQPWR